MVPTAQWQASEHNAPRTSQQQAARRARLVAKDAQRLAKIQAAGIKYEYKSLESFAAPDSQHVRFDDASKQPSKQPSQE